MTGAKDHLWKELLLEYKLIREENSCFLENVKISGKI